LDLIFCLFFLHQFLLFRYRRDVSPIFVRGECSRRFSFLFFVVVSVDVVVVLLGVVGFFIDKDLQYFFLTLFVGEKFQNQNEFRFAGRFPHIYIIFSIN